MLFYSLVLCFEIPLAIQNVVFPFYQCLRVFQPLNLVTSAKEHTTNSFFDLINNNSSCISYRINIALFVILEKKVSKEDGRSRQECLGQTSPREWMASINFYRELNLMEPSQDPVGKDLSWTSKSILRDPLQDACLQVNS